MEENRFFFHAAHVACVRQGRPAHVLNTRRGPVPGSIVRRATGRHVYPGNRASRPLSRHVRLDRRDVRRNHVPGKCAVYSGYLINRRIGEGKPIPTLYPRPPHTVILFRRDSVFETIRLGVVRRRYGDFFVFSRVLNIVETYLYPTDMGSGGRIKGIRDNRGDGKTSVLNTKSLFYYILTLFNTL